MKKIGVYLKKEFFLNQYLGDLIMRLLDSGEFEIYFFHFNKLSVDTKNTQLHESIYSIDLTNISLHRFDQLISQVGISFFLCSSFRNLFDYSVLSVVKGQNIKIVYFEHGLPVKAPYNYNFVLFKRYIRSYVIIFLKNLFMLIRFKCKYFKVLTTTIFGIRKSKHFFLFDFAILYSEYSRAQYSSWFDNDYTKIFFSGFPLFIDNLEKQKLKESSLNGNNSVLYIHQPLVEDTLVKIGVKEYSKLILKVAKIVECAGYDFVVKLHPRSDYESYCEILGDHLYNGDLNLTELIAQSDQIIGHFSSALAISLYFNKKTIKLHLPEFRVDGDEIFDEFCIVSNSFEKFKYDLEKEKRSVGKNDIQNIIGENNTHYDRNKVFLKLFLQNEIES